MVPWKVWPGVATCSGHFQKSCRNRQRQKGALWVVQMKKTNFWAKNCSIFFINPSVHSQMNGQGNSAP